MRTFVIGLSLAAASIVSPAASAPALSQQTSKYTLIVVANAAGAGVGDRERRDGAAMISTGIYLSRTDCEAAGAGIKFGAVGGGPDEKPTTAITWICVPLGKP